MDPQAAFEYWHKALKDFRFDEAKDYAEALTHWLKNGGFEPKWHPWEKLFFQRWCRRHNLLDEVTAL